MSATSLLMLDPATWARVAPWTGLPREHAGCSKTLEPRPLALRALRVSGWGGHWAWGEGRGDADRIEPAFPSARPAASLAQVEKASR